MHGTSHLLLANLLARTMGKGTNGEQDTVVCLGLPRTWLECAEADPQLRACRHVEIQILASSPKSTWTTLIRPSFEKIWEDSKCGVSVGRSSCGRSARSMEWPSRQFAPKCVVSMASKLHSMGFIKELPSPFGFMEQRSHLRHCACVQRRSGTCTRFSCAFKATKSCAE